jgi:hypothetical protein
MTISKRKNRKNLQRSRKGGEGILRRGLNLIRPRNAASNSNESRIVSESIPVNVEEGIMDIVVILSKLAGDVPVMADKLSADNDNAPVYFAWCPFNVKTLSSNELLTDENKKKLIKWKNVNHSLL